MALQTGGSSELSTQNSSRGAHHLARSSNPRGGRRGRGGRGGRVSRGIAASNHSRNAAAPPSVAEPNNDVTTHMSSTKVEDPALPIESNGKPVEIEAETEVCFICASSVVHQSIAPCNHRTCHICGLRMRALYKNRDCAHCRVVDPRYEKADFVNHV